MLSVFLVPCLSLAVSLSLSLSILFFLGFPFPSDFPQWAPDSLVSEDL